MQNNPYDDLLKNLAMLIEQISHLEEPESEESKGDNVPHIIGCAFFTGNGIVNSEKRAGFSMQQEVQIPYETMSHNNQVFITATLPVIICEQPDIRITSEKVIISAGISLAEIDLPWIADVATSSYGIRNGVIDVVVLRSSEESETVLIPDEQTG